MSYQVLALRWRPQVFDDLIGQESVTRTLKNAIEQGRIAHAFLFSGVRGVGKTTTARLLAKALNCSNADEPTVNPCGECASCKEIAASRSIDVLEIDGASHTKVDEIREVLDSSQYAPSRDRYKIYVIDEVHMLSIHSFNALLKTLEEPPPHLKFIFATTEYHKIPDTIVSRCQNFEFRTVSSKEITGRLRHIAEADEIEISDEALSQIARAAEGSMRDGLSAMDQVVAATSSRIEESDVADLLGLIAGDVLSRTVRAIVERDTAEILKVVDQLVTGGKDLQSFARGLMQLFRDILVIRVAPDSPELVEITGERDALVELSQRVTDEDLIRGLEVLTRTRRIATVVSRAAVSPRGRLAQDCRATSLGVFRRAPRQVRVPGIGPGFERTGKRESTDFRAVELVIEWYQARKDNQPGVDSKAGSIRRGRARRRRTPSANGGARAGRDEPAGDRRTGSGTSSLRQAQARRPLFASRRSSSGRRLSPLGLRGGAGISA